MATTNLGITEIVAGQDQFTVTSNEGLGQIDGAFASIETLTIDGSNALSITTEQMRRNLFFVLEPDGGLPPSSQITLTVPNVSRGLFVVINNTLEAVQVEKAGQSETAPLIAAGSAALLSLDASDVRQPAGGGGGGGGGGSVAVNDEGVEVTAAASLLNFVGGGVTATDAGSDQVNVSIPGAVIQGVQPIYTGALVRLSANFDPPDDADTVIPWNTQENQQLQEGLRFWLGPDVTFTADNSTDRLTATAHGMSTGDGPFEVSSAGTLPTGLAASTNYWCIRVDDNTLQVASSLANAKSGTAVTFSDNGTGAHTIERQARLVVPDGITAVEIAASVTASGDDFSVRPRKNGSLAFNGRFDLGGNVNTSGVTTRNGSSPPLIVTAGDYFDFVVSAAATVTVNSDPATWVSIRALQTSTAVQPQIVFGGDVLVESKPFSAEATVPFTDLNPQAGETFYVLVSIRPSNDAVESNLQVSTDNGVSFENSTYHHTTSSRWGTTGANQGGSAADANIRLQGVNASNDLGNAAGESTHIFLELGELANAADYKQFSWQASHVSSTGNNVATFGGGAWRGGTDAINALRFGISAGTISGRISIYKRSPTTANPLGQVLHVQGRRAPGSAGLASVAGSFQTRAFNTVRTNAIPGAALSSNQLTLPPGTYELTGSVYVFRGNFALTRIRDISANTTLAVLPYTYADVNTGHSSPHVPIHTILTLTATTTFEVQTRVTAPAANGFGLNDDVGLGEDLLDNNLLIRKLA